VCVCACVRVYAYICKHEGECENNFNASMKVQLKEDERGVRDEPHALLLLAARVAFALSSGWASKRAAYTTTSLFANGGEATFKRTLVEQSKRVAALCRTAHRATSLQT
jgi:hypothetical protein